MPLSSKITSLFIFFMSLLLFLYDQWSNEIIGFETRFYFFAQEALRHGLNWFPTIYNEFYPDYPVGGTALIFLSAKYFGELNKFTALFPAAIFSALTVSLTYLLGALRSDLWGKAAACFLLLTYLFMMSARYISLDIYPLFATTLSLYSVLFAFEKQQKFPWLISIFCMVFGFIFRGSLGLCLPVAAVTAACIVYANYRLLVRFLLISAVILFLMNVLLSAAAFHSGGKEFLNAVWHMQLFSRLHDAKSVPFYFYFIDTWGTQAIVFPVAIMVIAGLFLQKKKNTKNLEHHLLWSYFLFVLIVLLGMSIPADKKSRYILAIAPALSLLAGYLWIAPRDEKYWRIVRKLTQTALLFMPLMCVIVIVAEKKWVLLAVASVTYYWIIGSFLLAQLIAAAVALIMLRHLHKPRLLVLFLAVAATWCVWVLIFGRVLQKTEAAQDFVRAVEAQRLHSESELAFLTKDKDGFAIKYMINTQGEVKPLFFPLFPPQELMNKKIYFILDEKYFLAAQPSLKKAWHVMLRGKVGHQSVVVVQNQVK